MFYSDVTYNCIDLSDAYLRQISGRLHSFWLLSNIFLKIHFRVSEDLNHVQCAVSSTSHSSPSHTAASGPWRLGEDGVRSTVHRAGGAGDHSRSPVCGQPLTAGSLTRGSCMGHSETGPCFSLACVTYSLND